MVACEAAVLLHVADDSDNLPRLPASLQMAADGIFAEEEFGSERLAYHHNLGAFGGIRILEQATAAQRNAQRLEITRREVDRLDGPLLLVAALKFAEPEIQRTLIRQRERHTGGLHSRNTPNTIEAFGEEASHGIARLVAGILQRGLRGDHVARIESR